MQGRVVGEGQGRERKNRSIRDLTSRDIRVQISKLGAVPFRVQNTNSMPFPRTATLGCIVCEGRMGLVGEEERGEEVGVGQW
jgi:hypothetical protein